MDRVIVAVDGSERSKEALVYALEQFDGDITAVHVPITTGKDLRAKESGTELAERRGKSILKEAAETAEKHGREIETELIYGDVSKALVSYADDTDADQIVIGSRGKKGMKRILLGSVAESVVRRAGCPVTVVR